jgi:non-specific serine/threonine protein kinase
LTGPGGAGKTRLAIHVARGMLARFADGVWLVELSSLSDGADVPGAVAGVLELRSSEEVPLPDAVAAALHSRDILLVIDNCEHVVDSVAGLTQYLLERCPRLRILATSREPIGIPGETVVLVPALPIPGNRISEKDLLQVDAVRLLVDRVRYRQPDFQVSAENARVLASICRRLDGMPLALELAASRVGALSLQQINDRLSDALDLLTTGIRRAEPRQRTLRGALDWSYDLLGEDERALFMRLSVFRGGCTLSAAAAIGGAPKTDEHRVLDVLSRLVDKSLVLAEPAAGDEIRYRLLEPIRQYAANRLAESGESETVQSRHAALLLALAERAKGELSGSGQARWLGRLDREHDNLRAALGWSRASGSHRTGLRLAAALWLFWYIRGHVQEGDRWLGELLSACPERTRDRAEALRGRGALAYKRRQYGDAIAAFEEALAIFRELGDGTGAGACLANLATALQDSGELDRAMALHHEALALRQAVGDDVGAATTLSNIGVLHYLKGELDEASALLEESLDRYRTLGDTVSIAIGLNNLGELALKRGRDADASPSFRAGLTLAREVGEMEVVASCLEGLAATACRCGDVERAVLLDTAADGLRQATHSPLREGDQAERAARETQLRRALGEQRFEDLMAEARERSLDEIVRYALGDESEQRATDNETGKLSRRERHVAILVMHGRTNREIADRLHIGDRTVETHIRRALKKLQLSSRAQLAAWIAAEETHRRS